MRVFLPLKKKEKNDESPTATFAAGGDNHSDRETEEAFYQQQQAGLVEAWEEVHETESLDPTAVATAEVQTVAPAETTETESVAALASTENTLAVDLPDQASDSLDTDSTEPPSPTRHQEVFEKGPENEDNKSAPVSFSNDSATTNPLANSTAEVIVAPAARLPSPPRINNTALCSASPTINSRSTRKRRSSSPFATTNLDCKPSPSKKCRDSKPPARETSRKTNSTIVATGTASLLSSSNSNNMAGGNSQRGGRKQAWSGSPSYFVESSNSGGASASREGVSNNNSDERAEVDSRYTYRHENDPASARGDAPTATLLRVPAAAAAAASSNPTSVASKRHGSSKNSRDDDDVREATLSPDQQEFSLALKKKGLEEVEQEGDGNCLFRAISLQVYGDASMHGEVRHKCLDFMSRDKEHFAQFITDEPFEQYIGRKRQDGVHGNNPEIQASSELFNRPIAVFVPEKGATPLNIFHAEYKTQDAPIRLSYHDGNHYNAVIDPLVPTAGLGLGLPGLQPGLADKMQVAKAVAESDRLADQKEYERALEESQNDQLQRAIKESSLSVDHMYQNKALSLSDCDATNFELEQAVLESSLESFRTFEHGQKQASSSGKSASGRRKRQASPPSQAFNSSRAAAVGQSNVASMPSGARQEASSHPIPGAASVATASAAVAAAVAPAVASRPPSGGDSNSLAEHYPRSVQELVMNGFELRKVAHAYDVVGDSFDDLLGFLMSTGSS